MQNRFWMGLWMLTCAACAGELESPERFQGGIVPSCQLDVETDILTKSCALVGCHDDVSASTGLDLSGSGVGSRLIGVAAATMADHKGARCEGEGFLIDADNPDSSLLLRKVSPGTVCGSPMPFGGRLDDAEIACVRAYIMEATMTATSRDGGM